MNASVNREIPQGSTLRGITKVGQWMLRVGKWVFSREELPCILSKIMWFMPVYVYVHMYVCVSTCVCVYLCMCMHIKTYICTSVIGSQMAGIIYQDSGSNNCSSLRKLFKLFFHQEEDVNISLLNFIYVSFFQGQ